MTALRGAKDTTNYTAIMDAVATGAALLPQSAAPQFEYTALLDQQAKAQGYDPTVQNIYIDLIKAQQAGQGVFEHYDQYPTEPTQTKPYVDDLKDFEKWMYGTYGFEVDKSNWETMAKQYNYNKAREDAGLFTIDFDDPAYDPDAYNTLQNEYHQFIKKELGKKTDPRMAQYLFPEWINEQYAEYAEKQQKAKADLLGIKYKEGTQLPAFDYDYESAGYEYEDTPDDQQRKQYGLPPKAFLDLYDDKDTLAAGEAPRIIQNTENFMRDYNDFVAGVQRMVERGTASEEAIIRAYDQHDTFAALDEYFMDIEKHNESTRPGGKGWDAYNRKVLAGQEVKAPDMPVMDSALKDTGFGPGFLDDIIEMAEEQQKAAEEARKAAEPSGWQKFVGFLSGIFKTRNQGQAAEPSPTAPIAPTPVPTAPEPAGTLPPDEKALEYAALNELHGMGLTSVEGIKAAQFAEASAYQGAGMNAWEPSNAPRTVYEQRESEIVQRLSGAGLTAEQLQETDPEYDKAVKRGQNVKSASRLKLKPADADSFAEAIAYYLTDGGDNDKKRRAAQYIQRTFSVQYLDQLTDAEKESIFYLFGAGRRQEIGTFLDTMRPLLEYRGFQESWDELKEEVDAPGIGGEIKSGVFSVLHNMTSASAVIDSAISVMSGSEADPFAYPQLSAAASGEYAQAAVQNQGVAGKIFGGALISIANMATMLPMGPTGALVGMAANAAGAATAEAIKDGADTKKALASGIMAGVIEYLTENIPAEKLFSLIGSGAGRAVKAAIKSGNKKLLKSALLQSARETLKQAGIEATEEAVAEILGNLSDIAILGEQSSYQQYIQQLIESGMSAEDAYAQAAVQFFVLNPLQSAAAGAISGAFFGAGASFMGTATNALQTKVENRVTTRAQAIMDAYEAQAEEYDGTDAQRMGMEILERAVKSGEYVSTKQYETFVAEFEQTKAEAAESVEETGEPAQEPVQAATSATEGGVAPTTTNAAEATVQATTRPDTRPSPGFTERAVKGSTDSALTNDNQRIEFQYAVVPADMLIASNDETGRINPLYPAELQPRDRTRDASIVEIERIANDLQPTRLAEDSSVQNGAPFVGPDGVVESGNARVIAISKAYRDNKATKYERYIRDNAETFGINSANIPDAPVLIRLRTTDVDRAEFARKANESTVAAFSDYETAVMDAKKLTQGIMSLFTPNENGKIDTRDNREFIRKFIAAVIPKTEQGAFLSADGTLSQSGLKRIRNAIFQKAYDSAKLGERLTELLDDDAKNITRALVNSAPAAVDLVSGIESGTYYPITIVEDTIAAAEKYVSLREEGLSVSEYLNQVSFFSDDLSPEAKTILSIIEANKRSSTRIGGFLQMLYDNVKALGDPRQVGMFGDNSDIGKEEIIDAAVKRYEQETGKSITFIECRSEEGQTSFAFGEAIQGAGEVKGVNASIEPAQVVSRETRTVAPVESDAEIRAAVQETVSYAQQKGNPKKARPLSDILQVVKEWLDAPVSTKVFKRIKGSTITDQVRGWYQAFQNVIGIKPGNTYRFFTLFHEIGHRLDNKYDMSNGPVQDLQKKYLTDRITDNYPPEEHTGEMIADFFRDYFLNPNIARQNAPAFYGYVQYTLDQKDKRKTDSIRQLLADYLAQSREQRITGHVVPTGSQARQGLGVKIKRFANKLEIGLFDRYAPVAWFSKAIKSLLDEDLSRDPEAWLLYSQLSGKIASDIIEHNLFAPMNTDGSRGDVLDERGFAALWQWLPSATVRKQYVAYLASLHAIDRATFGKDAFPEIVATPQEIKDQVSAWESEHPEFKTHAQELYEWWDKFMTAWLVDTGLLEEKLYKRFQEMYPHYVPMYRQVAYGQYGNRLASGGFSGVTTPIKGAKKSDLPILDPVESMHTNILKYVTAVNRRQVMLAVADAYDAHPAKLKDFIVAEIDPKTIPHDSDLTDLKKQMAEALEEIAQGGDTPGLSGIDYEDFIDNILPQDTLTTFRKQRMADGQEVDVLTVIDRTGKQRFFHSDNPMFVEAIVGLNPQDTTGVLRFLTNAMNGFKALITFMNPLFAAPNLLRDTQEGLMWGSHKNPGQYAYDMGASVIDIMRGQANDAWRAYQQMGGGDDAGYVSGPGLSRTVNKKSIPFKALTGRQKAGRIARSILIDADAVAAFNNYLETLNRYAEFARSKKRGEADLKAILNSLEITLNFRRKGKWARVLDPIIPFYNAMMQDMYKTIRAVKNADTAAGRKQLATVTIRLFVYFALLGLLETWLNKDDEDYNNVPQNLKDKYWMLWKTTDGKFIRVPKPASVYPRFFSGMSRRSFDFANNDTEAFDGFVLSILTELTPAPIWSTITDISANRTWYGGTLEDYQDKKVSSVYRYDQSTSVVAKAIGRFTGALDAGGDSGVLDGMSPKEIEYMMDQYLGVLGDLIFAGEDVVKSFHEGDPDARALLGLIENRFITDPILSNKQMGDFYTLSDAITEAWNDIELYGKSPKIRSTGRATTRAFERVQEYISEGETLIREYKKAVAEIDSKNMSRAEHAEEARELRDKLNGKLKDTNKKLREFKHERMK